MTTKNKTNISIDTAKRFNVRRLLRSALAVGVVASFVSSASAQTELTLPAFPSDSVAVTLPSSQDAQYPFTGSQVVGSQAIGSQVLGSQGQRNSSAAVRLTKLLGLKKQTSNYSFPQVNPTNALPAFPSTSPTVVATQFEPEQTVASKSTAPSICRSSSGKSEASKLACVESPVVLASADERSFPSTASSNSPSNVIVQTALAVGEPASTEAQSLSESLSESLTESLSDIEIPSSLTRPAQELQQRLPELVKRPPAMQLHIGGNSGRASVSTTTEKPAPSPTNFSLSDSKFSESKFSESKFSDSNEITAPKATVKTVAANPMNIQVEGEPMAGIAVAKPPVSFATQETPAAPATQVAKATPVIQKTITEASSRNTGHKTVSDKGTEHAPAMGERLEVGLHESANLETATAISGLSVEHPELCQVLKSGERSVSFVGLKVGQTRVALFTTDAAGERKIEIRQVVIAGAENRQADMKSLASEIGKSVHSMFPNSRIEVIAEAEGLTVQGYAGSEDEAKKIISLVRRTSLQPVVDRLATYK